MKMIIPSWKRFFNNLLDTYYQLKMVLNLFVSILILINSPKYLTV